MIALISFDLSMGGAMLQNKFIGVLISGWFLITTALPAAIIGFVVIISGGPLDLHIRLPIFFSPVFLGGSGIGLLSQKKWARLAAIIVSSIVVICLTYVAIQSIRILSEHPEWTTANISFARTLIVIAIPFIWVVCYLIRPKVKDYFIK